MNFFNTVTPVLTPFGPSRLLGVVGGGTEGYATTIGGDNYYQPPTVRMSLACGAYNPSTITLTTDAIFCTWADAGLITNGMWLECRNLSGTPRMAANVMVASANTQAIASGGAGVPMVTAGQSMTYCGVYDGANVAAYYSSPGLGFGSASAAKTTTPTNLNRVIIGYPSTTLGPNRPIIWVAGWFRALSAADAQILVGSNGGLPQGLLIQATPRTYSIGAQSIFLSGKAITIERSQIAPAFPAGLYSRAFVDTAAGALFSPKSPIRAKGLTDVRGKALGTFLPNLIGGRGIDLKVGAKAILSFMGQSHLVLPIFPVLPPLTWSIHKKPIMASRVTIGATGRENQLAGAVYPRWAFNLSYGGQSWLRERTQNIVPDPTMNGLTELEQLSGLFLYVRGSFGEFYYEDPDDNSRNNQFVGTGDGTKATFPLTVSWGFGPFTPSFTYPVGGIKLMDSVYFDGVPQGTSEYNLDFNNTSLVFVAPPGVGVTITSDFDFYFRCRFLDDHLDFSQWTRNRWEAKEVRFESVKP